MIITNLNGLSIRGCQGNHPRNRSTPQTRYRSAPHPSDLSPSQGTNRIRVSEQRLSMRSETGFIAKFVRKDCHTGGTEEEMVPDGNSVPVYHQTNDNAAQTGSPATSGYPSFERRSKQTCQSGALYQVEETPNNRDERAEFHPSAACSHTHDSRTRALRLIRTQFLIVKRA